MQAQPRRVHLGKPTTSFQTQSTKWWRLLFKSAGNRDYVTWIGRLNSVHYIWIVSNRLSSRYPVRCLGFCHFHSPDIFFPRAIVIRRAIVIKLVLIGFTAGVQQDTDANLPTMITDLCQRFVELTFVLPLNVCSV